MLLTLAIVFLVAVAGCGLIFALKRQSAFENHTASPSVLPALPALNPLADLTFEDAMNGETFSLRLENTLSKTLTEAAVQQGFNVGEGAIQAVAGQRGSLTVTFQGKVFGLMKQPGGGYKAVAVGPNGRVMQLPRLDRTGQFINYLAEASAFLVAAAHFIADADTNRKIDRLTGHVQSQIDQHTISQRARLHTAYDSLREALNHPSTSEDRLLTIRDSIRTIRYELLGEAERDSAKLKPLFVEERSKVDKVKNLVKGLEMTVSDSAERKRRAELDAIQAKVTLAAKCLVFESLATHAANPLLETGTIEADAASQSARIVAALEPLEEELNLENPSAAIFCLLFNPPQE